MQYELYSADIRKQNEEKTFMLKLATMANIAGRKNVSMHKFDVYETAVYKCVALWSQC